LPQSARARELRGLALALLPDVKNRYHVTCTTEGSGFRDVEPSVEKDEGAGDKYFTKNDDSHEVVRNPAVGGTRGRDSDRKVLSSLEESWSYVSSHQ
jgi:hypothetical protein